MAGQSDKTEQPTQRRVQKSREQGNFPVSKDFVAAVQFVVFVVLLSSFGAATIQELRTLLGSMFRVAFTADLTVGSVCHMFGGALIDTAKPILWGGAALLGASAAAQCATTGFGVAGARLAPDFGRLNPARRLKDLPRQNLSAAAQAIVLLPLVSFAVYIVVSKQATALQSLPLKSISGACSDTAAIVLEVLWKSCAALLVVGCVDLFRQRRRHMADLRMSKQEVRDEHKEMEGNPQMKQRIRRLQRDSARRNMMKNVPAATAVIVNPTHYAIALKYDMNSMIAPVVLAKGKNYLARRIRELATANNIPIVENPPLAQALYKSVDVGHEIPAHLYRAVAEILAYIYRLTHPSRGVRR